MALKSPDMSNCNKKLRCLTGVNAGLAYDPSDPCPIGSFFDELSCNCISQLPEGFGYWRWVGGATNGALLGSNTSGGTTTGWFSNNYSTSGGVATQRVPGWWTVNFFIHTGTPAQSGQNDSPKYGVPLNGSGSLTKALNCSGGGVSLAYIYFSFYTDGALTSSSTFAYSLSSARIDADVFWCDSSVPIGYTASYSGVWQFSPTADPNNITIENGTSPDPLP